MDGTTLKKSQSNSITQNAPLEPLMKLRLGELTCTKSRKSHSNHCSWCQKTSKVLFVTCLLHHKLSSGPELCCPRRRLEQDRRLWLQTPEQNKNLFASDKILQYEQRSTKAMASSWHYSIFNWKGQINSQAGHSKTDWFLSSQSSWVKQSLTFGQGKTV